MFNSPEFITTWQEWKEHKKEKHGQPYTAVSERKALATLWQKSHGVESLAIESLNWCMEMNWSGIYIKKRENERESNTEIRNSVQSEFAKRYGS
jgi:hypothetical protein